MILGLCIGLWPCRQGFSGQGLSCTGGIGNTQSIKLNTSFLIAEKTLTSVKRKLTTVMSLRFAKILKERGNVDVKRVMKAQVVIVRT